MLFLVAAAALVLRAITVAVACTVQLAHASRQDVAHVVLEMCPGEEKPRALPRRQDAGELLLFVTPEVMLAGAQVLMLGKQPDEFRIRRFRVPGRPVDAAAQSRRRAREIPTLYATLLKHTLDARPLGSVQADFLGEPPHELL